MEESYLYSSDDEGSKQKENSNLGSDDSDVSEPVRFRCPILYGIGSDRFLRAYNFYFLPIIGIAIYSVFLLSQS